MSKTLRPILGAVGVVAVGVLVLVLKSQASVVTNIDIPISGVSVNPCNGESVTFNGVLHTTMNTIVTGSGTFHATVHNNAHVTGAGDQGNTYVGNMEFASEINSGRVGGENNLVNVFSLISNGSAPNFDIHVLLHLTVNAKGTVTASLSDFTSVCRG